MTQPIIVPAGHGRLVTLHAGECLTVINTHGTQVVDTWAFNSADPTECMSMEQSRSVNSRLFPSPGQCFVSTRRRAMLRLVDDTSPGDHDTLLCACNSAIYRELGCTGYHRSCEDNLRESLATAGITLPFIPAPLNLFMNVGVGPSGTVLRRPPSSRPGDRVVLQAEMELHAVMSACPQDVTPINGEERTPRNVAVEVFPTPVS
jgi:uncharacterized protein YcgI (DUF1989 family)